MESCRKIAMALFLSAVAVCFTSGFASAQVVSRGSFNLSNDTQWGKKVLPKGSYNFTVRETGMMGVMVAMTSADNSSHEIQLMGMQRSADVSLKGSASTVIVTHGKNGDILRGIYLADRGLEYTFPVHPKGKTTVAANSKPGSEITMRIPVHGNAK